MSQRLAVVGKLAQQRYELSNAMRCRTGRLIRAPTPIAGKRNFGGVSVPQKVTVGPAVAYQRYARTKAPVCDKDLRLYHSRCISRRSPVSNVLLPQYIAPLQQQTASRAISPVSTRHAEHSLYTQDLTEAVNMIIPIRCFSCGKVGGLRADIVRSAAN